MFAERDSIYIFACKAKIMVATSVCTGGRNCPLDSSTAIGSSLFRLDNIKRVIPNGITLLMEKALIIDTICGDRRAIVPPL